MAPGPLLHHMLIRRDRARAYPHPFRLILAALFALINWGGLLYGLFAITMAYLNRGAGAGDPFLEPVWGNKALIGFGTALVGLVMGLIHSHTVKCPLCHGTPFHARRCRMHHAAIKFPLLSYRNSALLCLMFLRKFVCMYCGTAFRWKK